MMSRVRERWWIFLLVVGVVLGGRVVWQTSQSPVVGVDREFTVVAKKYEYTPNVIHVNHGDRVTIRLMSQDVHHGLYLDGYAKETSARPGEMGVIRFVADKKGRFPFRCSVTCGSFHPYMIGYLKVGPNSRFAGAVLLLLVISLAMGGYLYTKTSGGNSA